MVLELIERVGLSNEYNSEESWDSLDSIGNLYKLHNITEPLVRSFLHSHLFPNISCFFIITGPDVLDDE